jgi:Zn finger protein HypA/HybF involved in hydrogenase expression
MCDIMKKACKDCGEQFEPKGRDCICSECKQFRIELGKKERARVSI